MGSGKILKVRMGHEANCSSGMVALYMLFLGGVTYVPISVIASAIQASRLEPDTPSGWSRHSYWVIPQIPGLLVTAYLVYGAFNSGYGITGPLVVALAMGAAFSLSVVAGYVLAPRIKHGFLVCLAALLVLILGFVALWWLSGVFWEPLSVVLDRIAYPEWY